MRECRATFRRIFGDRPHETGKKGQTLLYKGNGTKFTVYDFRSGRQRNWAKEVSEIAEYKGAGHGGGDLALVRDFLRAVDAHDEAMLSSSLAASVESHVMGFACERSRLSGGKEPVAVL